MTTINKSLSDFIESLDYLAARWQDEREYEDFADYIAAAKKATPEGMEFVSLSKRFVCVVKEDDKRHTISIHANSVYVDTEEL